MTRRAKLSDLQREVLYLVLQGKSNREIADELIEDEDTIKHRVRRSLSKFGITRRTQVPAKIDEIRQKLAAHQK